MLARHLAYNASRSQWTSVLKKLAIRTLGICSAMVILGLFGVQEAHAQTFPGPLRTGTFTISPGGTVAIGQFKFAGTLKCPQNEPTDRFSDEYDDWEDCQRDMVLFFGLSNELPPEDLVRPAIRSDAQPSGTATLTLSSSTPFLPFLGNRLAVVSYVPNATTFADMTAAYATRPAPPIQLQP